VRHGRSPLWARRSVPTRGHAIRGQLCRAGELAAGLAERNLGSLAQSHFALHPLAIHVGAVQAAQVFEDELVTSQFYDAVFFTDDLIQNLDRVVRVSPKRVAALQLKGALTLGGR
jgi:hypothetical protein